MLKAEKGEASTLWPEEKESRILKADWKKKPRAFKAEEREARTLRPEEWMAKALKPKQTGVRTLRSEEKAAYGKTRRKRYQASQTRIKKLASVHGRKRIMRIEKKRKAWILLKFNHFKLIGFYCLIYSHSMLSSKINKILIIIVFQFYKFPCMLKSYVKTGFH